MCDDEQVWEGVDKTVTLGDTSLGQGQHTCAVRAYRGSVISGDSNAVAFELGAQ